MTKLIFHKLVWKFGSKVTADVASPTSCAEVLFLGELCQFQLFFCYALQHLLPMQQGNSQCLQPKTRRQHVLKAMSFHPRGNGHQATFESQLQSAWTLLRAIRRNTSQHLSKGNWDAARKCWQPPFSSPWWTSPDHQHSLPLSTAQPLVAEVHTVGTRSNAFVLNFFLPRRGFHATEGLSHVPCWSEGKSWSQQVHSHINDMNHDHQMKHHKLL